MIFNACFGLLFVINFWNVVQSENVMSFWCRTATSLKPRRCHHFQVPVPLPFECDEIRVHCHLVENLFASNTSGKLALLTDDGFKFNEYEFINDCSNQSMTYTKSGHWKIKLERMSGVYAVYVRTLGRSRKEVGALQVKLSRRISNKLLETSECFDFLYYNGFHTFYCYSLNGTLTSSYRPGFDSHFVEIIGEVYVESCTLQNLFKIYSYPVKICGIPESHSNQLIDPVRDYYVIGLQVTYKCSGNNFTLIGNSTRVCQHNGLWSGDVPQCVIVQEFRPQTLTSYPKGRTGLYLPTKSLVNASRIDEKEAIIFGFDDKYCVKQVYLEFHSELSIRTNITLGTVSSDNSEHIWKSNGSFGEDANKHHFSPIGEEFECLNNITIQRHSDIPLEGTYKRVEFIYKIEMIGYRYPGSYCLIPGLFPHITIDGDRNRSIMSGTTLQLECENGFYESRNEVNPQSLNCTEGVWNGDIPTCLRKHCPLPKDRSHLSWTFFDNGDNEQPKFNQIQYACDIGFQLNGNENSTCIDGKWSSQSPKCTVTYCPSISIPSHLFCMLDRKKEFHIYDDNVTSVHHGIGLSCYCFPGFQLIGNKTIYCHNKEWTSSLPECQEIFCTSPPFVPYRGVNDTIEKFQWSIGSHNFSCPEEFFLKGVEDRDWVMLECLESGEWREKGIYECAKQVDGVTSGQTIGLVVGVSFALVLFFAAFFLLIKKFCKPLCNADDPGESERKLTVFFEDEQFIFLSKHDGKNGDTSESEIDVEEV